MLGAIAGDICGSSWEGAACPKERFELFGYGTAFTDDTVCTIAVANALLNDLDIAKELKAWTNRYPNRGYGGKFIDWAQSDMGPYNSFANGGAMRVAPAGLLATSLENAEALSDRTAEVTHNHPEGMRGARAIAGAIWLARQGLSVQQLREQLTLRYGYDLSPTVASLAENFGFTVLAEETVPMALIAALEATSWADAVANAVAIGGDADTLACMAGAVAEARFGLPAKHAQAALPYLSAEMLSILEALYAKANLPAPWVTSNNSQANLTATLGTKGQERSLVDQAKAWWNGRKSV